MDGTRCRVHVVVDPACGDHLHNIPAGDSAWVVDSPANHFAISEIWNEAKSGSNVVQITPFKFDPEADPEGWLISALPAIDLHHGGFSSEPPYSELNVIGVCPSGPLAEALNAIGFVVCELTDGGFLARRVAR